MTEPRLGLERVGAVAWVTIDDPARRNAVTLDMWRAFGPLLAELEADEGVAVLVLRGAGEHFSAGANIAELPQIFDDADAGVADGGWVTAAEEAIARFSKPTIAAIDGHCVGGGWELAGACDIRIASDRAIFGITPARLGILYPFSGIRRLTEIAGPAVAKYLLLSGELVDAATALRLGLVLRTVPAETLWDVVTELAATVASRSQLTVRAMKELVDHAADGTDASDALTRWHAELAASDESQTGIAAFLAKQPPQFGWRGPTPR